VGERRKFFGHARWTYRRLGSPQKVEFQAAPDGLDWLYRPVVRGWCKLESLYDGTLTLAMIAEANEMIDLVDENEARLSDAVRNGQ
jgi:hypothetical protein